MGRLTPVCKSVPPSLCAVCTQDIKVDVVALLNDTTGTQMALGLSDPDCFVGLILGTSAEGVAEGVAEDVTESVDDGVAESVDDGVAEGVDEGVVGHIVKSAQRLAFLACVCLLLPHHWHHCHMIFN